MTIRVAASVLVIFATALIPAPIETFARGGAVISLFLKILLHLLSGGAGGAHRFSERLDGYPKFFHPVLALVFFFQPDTTRVVWLPGVIVRHDYLAFVLALTESTLDLPCGNG